MAFKSILRSPVVYTLIKRKAHREQETGVLVQIRTGNIIITKNGDCTANAV